MADLSLNNLGPDLKIYFPHLILLAFSLIVLLFETIIKDELMKKISLIFLTISSFFLTAISAIFYIGAEKKYIFSHLLIFDHLSLFFLIIFVIIGGICYIVSIVENEMKKYSIGEFFFLLISLIFGLSLMVDSNNLLMLLVSIELVSLSSYALSGYFYNASRSSESALKYALFGASTSGIALFGLTLISASCGSFQYEKIGYFNDYSLAAVGWVLFLSVILYKISAVPFHMWTPDVYEGAPLAIAAILSTAPKAAGFVVIIRILDSIKVNSQLLQLLFNLFSLISAVTMTFGNLFALKQTNYKRLLAYSTISHSGYILVGVSAFAMSLLKNEGIIFSLESILFYIVIYIAMNLGTFLYLGYFANYTGESINNLNGLGKYFVIEGVFTTIFLLSLTGIPPTGGFIAKLNIFASAIQLKELLWLVIIALLNTIISVGYYFKIFRNMFFPVEKTAVQNEKIIVDKNMLITVNITGSILITVIILSCLYPDIFYHFTHIKP